MSRSKLLAVGLAALLGAAIAGCGDDDEEDAAPAGAAAEQPAGGEAPKGPAIKIGTIGSYTGPEAPSLGAMDETMEAWAQHTNATGGINGHPVELIVEDDGNNPTKAKQLARKLIEQDKVIALVGIGSVVTESWGDVAAKAKVPVIGSTDFQQEFSTNPFFFATGAQIPAMVYGTLADAKKAGVTKVGVLPCAEVAACEQFAGLFEAVGGIVGVPVDFKQKITVSQPSYASVCQAAKSKDVDGLITLQNAATVVRVADQCAQQGYEPTQLNTAGTAGKAWEGQANLEGAVTTHSNAVPAAENVPAIKTFHEALDRHAPEVKDGEQFNVLDSSAWAGGEAFKLAAERAKLTPKSTSADVLEGLYTFEQETLGGLTPPLTYQKGKPAFTTCWFPQTLEDGEFVALNDGKAECIPEADLPKLQKVLGG